MPPILMLMLFMVCNVIRDTVFQCAYHGSYNHSSGLLSYYYHGNLLLAADQEHNARS